MTQTELIAAMEAYGPMVYRLALCRMQNAADAEDVYQDVFLRLLQQKLPCSDPEHTKAWLIRTTLNRCTDIGRFRLRRPAIPLEEAAELASPPSPQDSALWDAVSGLPVKFRLVIHLHYAEGYSTKEIAALLSIPPATVRTRLRRGREKLKQILGGDHDA